MGCCSLRVEHVKESEQPNMLHLNFLGKDSIEYDNTTEVLPEVMELALTLTRPLAMTPDPAPTPNPNPKHHRGHP